MCIRDREPVFAEPSVCGHTAMAWHVLEEGAWLRMPREIEPRINAVAAAVASEADEDGLDDLRHALKHASIAEELEPSIDEPSSPGTQRAKVAGKSLATLAWKEAGDDDDDDIFGLGGGLWRSAVYTHVPTGRLVYACTSDGGLTYVERDAATRKDRKLWKRAQELWADTFAARRV